LACNNPSTYATNQTFVGIYLWVTSVDDYTDISRNRITSYTSHIHLWY